MSEEEVYENNTTRPTRVAFTIFPGSQDPFDYNGKCKARIHPVGRGMSGRSTLNNLYYLVQHLKLRPSPWRPRIVFRIDSGVRAPRKDEVQNKVDSDALINRARLI
ncbi:hypothetical protein MTP99_013900 [Tenebrio molitor]|nr:hypothetical protein MTP99_013900 [Tenebrio molitor]